MIFLLSKGKLLHEKKEADADNGKKIEILAEKDPANLPWGKIGVDVVLECTGFFASKAKSQAHIDADRKSTRLNSSHSTSSRMPSSA